MATKDVQIVISYVNLIPNFNGDKALLADFLFQVEGMATLVDDSLKSTFLKLILNSKLTGKALENVKNKTITTWANLKTILCDQNNVKSSNWQMRLMSENQNSDESVTDFGKRLNRLFEECINPSSDLDEADLTAARKINEEFLLLCYRRGIVSNEIRESLTRSSVTKLSKAIELAQTIENNIKSNKLLTQTSLFHFNSQKHCTICNRNNHDTNNCLFKNSSNQKNQPNFSQQSQQNSNQNNRQNFYQQSQPNSNQNNRQNFNQQSQRYSQNRSNLNQNNKRNFNQHTQFSRNQNNQNYYQNNQQYSNPPNFQHSNMHNNYSSPLPGTSSNQPHIFYVAVPPGNPYFQYPHYAFPNPENNSQQSSSTSQNQEN